MAITIKNLTKSNSKKQFNKIQNRCIDCGKVLSADRYVRCNSCSNRKKHELGILNSKSKNNPRFIDGRTNKKYYCINCSKEITRSSGVYGKKRCYSCTGKHRYYSIKTRNKMSKNHMGKKNFNFGKIFAKPFCKYFKKYKNIIMRSNWEVEYAKYLDRKNIKWIYEFRYFDLGYTTYTPDFYLLESNEYIEIKGWFTNLAKRKLNLLKELYPQIKLTILRKEDLINLGVLNGDC